MGLPTCTRDCPSGCRTHAAPTALPPNPAGSRCFPCSQPCFAHTYHPADCAIAGRGASTGVGFAIPIDTVKGLVEQILTYGRVIRPVLGISIAPQQVSLREVALPSCKEAVFACGPAWTCSSAGMLLLCRNAAPLQECCSSAGMLPLCRNAWTCPSAGTMLLHATLHGLVCLPAMCPAACQPARACTWRLCEWPDACSPGRWRHA
jgi:hypothetical protein